MGTNYYWVKKDKKCETCGHTSVEEKKHIGKSSGGWCFSLHVYTDEGIHDLPNWIDKWVDEQGLIEDEYGEPVTIGNMLESIQCRRGGRNTKNYSESWYRENHAVAGPHGLARHTLGQGCLRHGRGTWDCIEGDFS